MSVRVSLLAVATLALAGCNFSKAPEEQAACDCKPAAAPAAKAVATAKAASTEATAATVTRVVHRKAPTVRRERSERRYYSDSSSERDYAGGYGRRYAGVSVSVSETESSSERYRYSESEERYGSSRGSAYGSSSGSGYASTGGGYYAQGDGRYGPPPPPRGRPYHLAGKDRDGYLTWPGKVED